MTTTAEGKTLTEARYWSCSNCGHREWASTAEYKEWVPNPPPSRGGMWRFRAKINPTWCGCQKRNDDEFKNRKVHEYAIPTMKMYKTTIWLGPGESLPNIGIMVTLQGQLEGADPVPENDINTTPKETVPLVMPIAPVVASPLKPQAADPVESSPDDPDQIFKGMTGIPNEGSKPL